jgi:hypothetical protein
MLFCWKTSYWFSRSSHLRDKLRVSNDVRNWNMFGIHIVASLVKRSFPSDISLTQFCKKSLRKVYLEILSSNSVMHSQYSERCPFWGTVYLVYKELALTRQVERFRWRDSLNLNYFNKLIIFSRPKWKMTS